MLFEGALAAIRPVIARVAGIRVTYVRGQDQVTITAVPGKGVLRTENSASVVEEIASDDWLIEAGQLILNGERIEPRHGDAIRKQDGSEYEVMAPNNEPAWRWTDQFNTWMRVHSKEIN